MGMCIRDATPKHTQSLITRFMWPTWGPPGSCRPQVGPMLATWTLLSGILVHQYMPYNMLMVYVVLCFVVVIISYIEIYCKYLLIHLLQDCIIASLALGNYVICTSPWWRHQMETFSALLALCAWNSPVTGEFPSQRPVTWSFDVFFDLGQNKRLSKQSWGWWFEMPSCSLLSHCNAHWNNHQEYACENS